MLLPSLIPVLVHAALARAATHAERAPSGSKAVIAQMFEWNWDSIAAECTSFLGPAGYGFVQASPAQEHVQGSQWWTDYQPVSYILTSKRGNRSQYQNMINTCHAAGVKVIADSIWNHMSGEDSGTGVAGSSFTHYNYPGIYQNSSFHHCGLESGDDIVNWDDETEVWTCELDNLADLATDTDAVRQQLAAYANDLISLGVDGFRLDAAKNINPADIANILSRLTTKPYITQEVYWGEGEPVTPAMYTGNGDVQEFRYTTALRDGFLTSGISALQNLDNQGWVAGSSANAIVCNHDTERNSFSLNAYSPSNTYTLATVFALAHPYGTPTVLSSYDSFPNFDAGAPNSGIGTCSGSIGADGWFCQHRWPAIAGMVGFRNHVGSAALAQWTAPTSQRIAFARGTLGFVAINNADTPWQATLATGLPAGSYCNVAEGAPGAAGTCTGSAVTIAAGGSVSVNIGARQALAVHTGALGIAAATPSVVQVPVMFSETANTTFGENIFVVGSVPQLGNWDPSNAIPLDPTSYPVWGATAYLPPNTAFQFKFIRKETDGSIVWESDPNRQATTPTSGTQGIVTSWR